MEKIDLGKKDNKMLKMNFAKAISDEDFKELVSNLNLNENVLMKYTTRLMTASKEYKNCKNCKALVNCKNEVKGFCLTPINENDNLTFVYQKCEYKRKLDKNSEYLKNIYYFEVPPILKSANFKNIYKDDKNRLEIIKKIKEFYDNYKNGVASKGIYLSGNFGSGKSYLIAALFNELAKLNYKSAIIYFPDFLRKLKLGFGYSGEEYQELFDNIKKVPLLLIDDIGAEKLTDWARDEILGSMLQYRMDFKLPTFFTSNLNLKELENHLQITNTGSDKIKARRIIERVKYLANEVILIGINRRSE